MAKFIEVTFVGGQKVIINADKIAAVFAVPRSNYTLLSMDGSTNDGFPNRPVTETYDAIKHLLEAK